MNKVNVSIKIDKKLKQDFNDLCIRNNTNMAAALNFFIINSIKDNQLLFELKEKYIKEQEEMLAFQQAIDEIMSNDLRYFDEELTRILEEDKEKNRNK